MTKPFRFNHRRSTITKYFDEKKKKRRFFIKKVGQCLDTKTVRPKFHDLFCFFFFSHPFYALDQILYLLTTAHMGCKHYRRREIRDTRRGVAFFFLFFFLQEKHTEMFRLFSGGGQEASNIPFRHSRIALLEVNIHTHIDMIRIRDFTYIESFVIKTTSAGDSIPFLRKDK